VSGHGSLVQGLFGGNPVTLPPGCSLFVGGQPCTARKGTVCANRTERRCPVLHCHRVIRLATRQQPLGPHNHMKSEDETVTAQLFLLFSARLISQRHTTMAMTKARIMRTSITAPSGQVRCSRAARS
jgi:hypothetical protein